jgi:hypothetical protein
MRRKRNSSRSRVLPSVVIAVSTLAAAYLGMSLYSANHFHFGTKINGVNVGGKTVEDAEGELSSQMQKYTLELQEKGDEKEQIKGTDIGLKYDNEKIKELKDKQNSFAWPSTLFKKDNAEADKVITYDENLLNKAIDNLKCVTNKKTTNPQNASLKYNNGSYEIVEEVAGNKINKEALHDSVADAIVNGKASLDLSSSNSYENPKYNAKSQEVADAKSIMDKYVNLKITYKSNGKTEILDGSTIHDWLSVNENMEVTFNEDKVKRYVNKIASIFNTFGNTRDFVTASNKTVQVSGGNYGWIVNKSQETKDLIEAIKGGQDVTKEPAYSQKAAVTGSNDVGNTYVEVNLTKQHVWFYKNGSLIVDGDVVTGNVSNNTGTPVGTYVLNYKEKNATLKGEDYSSPVDYWMPFNGNVGLHDASWRSEFGKQIYLASGSHGCVNCPYNLAQTIFANIEAGTPIVVYNE